MESLLRILLYTTTFTIPLEWYFSVGHVSITRVLLAVVLGLSLLNVLMSLRVQRPMAMHWLALSFVGWSTFTLAWTLDPGQGMSLTLKYVLYIGFVFAMWKLVRTERELHVILGSYLWGCFCLVALLLVNYLTGAVYDPGASYTRYAVEGMNPNLPAILISTGIPVAWYLTANDEYRLFRVLFLPAALFCVVISGSRTALIITLLALAYCVHPIISRSRRSARLIAAALVIITIGIFVAIPDAHWSRLALLLPDVAQERDYTNPRFPIWIAGLDVALDDPFFGVGAGSFHEAISERLGYSIGAHNTFLAVFSETGAIGLGLFLFVVATLGLSVARQRSRDAVFCVILLSMWFLAANSFNYVDYTYTWLIFGLVLAASRRHSGAGVRTVSKGNATSRRYRAVAVPLHSEK